jgi:hypothetical protein
MSGLCALFNNAPAAKRMHARSRARSAAAGRASSIAATMTTLWLGASAAFGQIVETPIPEDPIAIDSGAVTGKVLSSGVKAYFGIPYAVAPTGDLRWREPQPVQAWKGVYHADPGWPPNAFRFCAVTTSIIISGKRRPARIACI